MGCRRKPVYRRVVCNGEGLAPDDGAGALWCDVLVSVPLDEATVRPIAPETTIGEIWPELQKRIGDWNVEGEREDGTAAVLPIPKDLGDDGYLKVDERVTGWLAWAVRLGWGFAGDQGKDSSSPAPTDEPPPSGDEPSPRSEARSRRRRAS